ncbi:hypothetical protein ACTI_84400 [Actinoplanes sp. OR16]|uniref:hypothetical protein n=1 Tax=Actinoplanes sp. OR16 TaxID=946334 RepID=UPI000F6C0187|nr:hypothetical protein [Actinoplanes sp. OR16]BBH71755.1 hypothetical protein ACTI_84400 [Actinoplanes sp. OR16]
MRSGLMAATAAGLLILTPSAAWAAAPAVPASLAVGGVACAPGGILIGSTTPQVTASVTIGVGSEFAVWPVGERHRRIAWTGPVSTSGTVFTSLPSELSNGTRYRLTARAVDAGGTASEWAPACTFTVDTVPPRPPVVTSRDYPANTDGGGAGVTGAFTFAAAGGDDDVAKFRYSWTGGGLREIEANRRGRATVELTPDRVGGFSLTVVAVDRTGNRSAETTYDFSVLDRQPRVWDQNPEGAAGEPRTVRLSSAVPRTASFTYQLNDAPARTVAADAAGVAVVTLTPDRRGSNPLVVTSRTASGVVSPETRVSLWVLVQVPKPVITSPQLPDDGTPPPVVGTELTFHFTTGSPEVTEFVWSSDYGATEQVVPADANGNATVRYTPIGWPYVEIQAKARTADGFESDPSYAAWELTPDGSAD